MAPALSDIPRELLQIIVRFIPSHSYLVLRANRALWALAADDPFIWKPMVSATLRSNNGVERVCSGFVNIAACCRKLLRMTPLPVRLPVDICIASPQGTTLLYLSTPDDSLRDVVSGQEFCGNPVGECEGVVDSILVFETKPLRWVRNLRWPGSEWYASTFLSDDGFAAISPDGTLAVWNARTGSTRAIRDNARVEVLAAGMDVFATANDDLSITMWSNAAEQLWQEHRVGPVCGMVFANASRRLVVLIERSRIYEWDVATGALTFQHRTQDGVAISVSSGDLLAVHISSGRNEIRILRLGEGSIVKRLSLQEWASSVSMYFARDGVHDGTLPVAERLYFRENTNCQALWTVEI